MVSVVWLLLRVWGFVAACMRSEALASALSSQLFSDFALESSHQRRELRSFFLRAFTVLKVGSPSLLLSCLYTQTQTSCRGLNSSSTPQDCLRGAPRRGVSEGLGFRVWSGCCRAAAGGVASQGFKV